MVDTTIQEIDAAHKAANNALGLKQFDNYISVFADNLEYKQLNGEIIGKQRLTKDIKNYFGRIRKSSGEFERIDFSNENGKIVEKVLQRAKATIRVFINPRPGQIKMLRELEGYYRDKI